MKITIDRDTLSKSLRRCDLRGGGALGNPALSGVALSARRITDMPGGLDLRATNGLLGIATMITCNTEREGDVFLNTKQLASVVNMMPPGALTLDSPGEELTVSNGKRRWRGKTMPLTDVKQMPDAPNTPALKLPAEAFLAGLERVGFVVPNVSREHMIRVGVLIDAPGDSLTFVVIGEHMIATARSAVVPTTPWRGVIPDIALAHAREIATEEDRGSIEIFADEHYTWIQNSSTVLVYPPPPGEYLDWRLMLSRITHTPVCRVPRLALLESLKALITACPEDVPRTWVQVQPDATITLDYADREGRVTFHDDVTVTDLTKSELPAFIADARYFRDALDAAGSDAVLNYVNDRHVSLTTEDGFLWTCALIHPDPGESPPGGGVPLSKPPAVTPPDRPPAAEPLPEKPKKSGGRKPK
jgi:DNA polymerase III sliding clamp (beta) subunit (PCNA family)